MPLYPDLVDLVIEYVFWGVVTFILILIVFFRFIARSARRSAEATVEAISGIEQKMALDSLSSIGPVTVASSYMRYVLDCFEPGHELLGPQKNQRIRKIIKAISRRAKISKTGKLDAKFTDRRESHQIAMRGVVEAETVNERRRAGVPEIPMEKVFRSVVRHWSRETTDALSYFLYAMALSRRDYLSGRPREGSTQKLLGMGDARKSLQRKNILFLLKNLREFDGKVAFSLYPSSARTDDEESLYATLRVVRCLRRIFNPYRLMVGPIVPEERRWLENAFPGGFVCKVSRFATERMESMLNLRDGELNLISLYHAFSLLQQLGLSFAANGKSACCEMIDVLQKFEYPGRGDTVGYLAEVDLGQDGKAPGSPLSCSTHFALSLLYHCLRPVLTDSIEDYMPPAKLDHCREFIQSCWIEQQGGFAAKPAECDEDSVNATINHTYLALESLMLIDRFAADDSYPRTARFLKERSGYRIKRILEFVRECYCPGAGFAFVPRSTAAVVISPGPNIFALQCAHEIFKCLSLICDGDRYNLGLVQDGVRWLKYEREKRYIRKHCVNPYTGGIRCNILVPGNVARTYS